MTKKKKRIIYGLVIVIIILLALLLNPNESQEQNITSTEKTENTTIKKTNKFQKKKIDLSNENNKQFDGANIQPLNAKIDKKGNLTYYFDWRNDWAGVNGKSSFNGTGLVIQAYQDNQELESNYSELMASKSDFGFKTEKNITTTLDITFKLIDPNNKVIIKTSDLDNNTYTIEIDID
ncbi:hypothetical protein M2901_10100 (plasmid) [Vagococcus lutrae]|nr:hypothetical protein M2901_10100 [Vagococcus lutrae]